jgi:signal-transduction protein with cAMP-binding, CBS, and nucleotidyltransferase domain
MMRDDKISQIPYLDGNDYRALLDELAVYEMNPDEPLQKQVKNNYLNPYSMEEQHIIEVFSLFGRNNIMLLPVVDAGKNYTGVLMAEDVTMAMGTLSSSNCEGAVIVLETPPYDYSLSHIAQIVESSDAKILQLFVNAPTNTENLEIIIRVDQTMVHRMLQTFYRYNYIVKSVFSSTENGDDLKERYSMFMKYLNI